ncbi:hypothetical protein GUJ93_ZPchr0004g38152 [Zizania palustris]|uniref:Ubiquitin-like protease family profile domain-containing protein n=1 Tax=Zizania palustris TaxID=103762 RepID=A0A8J5SLF7_ZIZPA|nr:hypothetical protein GUJ93_ZPchr0004g38152 [Zizania palustris]
MGQGQGHVLESGTSSAGFLYGKAAGVVKIHPAAKAKRDHPVKEKGVKPHDKHRSPPADANTKRSKSKGQSASKTMEYRHIPYGFLHLQPLLRGLGDHLSDGQQKIEFLSALELHDKDVDDAIIKINETHKDIEEAQQKFHERCPQNTQTVVMIVQRLLLNARHNYQQDSLHLSNRRWHMHQQIRMYNMRCGCKSSTGDINSRRQLRQSNMSQHNQQATTVEHDEVELPAADTTNEVIYWNEVGNILRELNEDPTQVSLRKEYDIKEAAALTGEKVLLSSCSWGLSYIDAPKQVLVNDCGFFVMLFLEHYDGEHRKFDVPIIPGPSLELFELLAPGTQQIIDSSDATKVGVASCDVEKDDVASHDE